MAIIQIFQDGYPKLPMPDIHKYPNLTDDKQLRAYLEELVKALNTYFEIQKTDADNINAQL